MTTKHEGEVKMNEQKLFEEVLKLRARCIQLEDALLKHAEMLGLGLGFAGVAREMGLAKFLAGEDLRPSKESD
jgi:hypothetical protein